MVTQGLFFALGPKSNFPIEIVSLLGLGFGMGLVDGCAPALLAQVTDLRHGGTGIVYTVNTMSIQVRGGGGGGGGGGTGGAKRRSCGAISQQLMSFH